MKLLLSLLCLFSPTLTLADTIDEEYELSPQVTALVMGYKGTSTPCIPDPDEEQWTILDSPSSSAPGRMRLPKHIVVDKPHTRLYVINMFGDTLCRYRVCASLKRGQKQKMDDWRTPEGTFGLMGVYNSTDWTYKDTQDNCYGPYFVSLITPRFWGIGIHGTNSPYSVPGRRSHGCMRMHNEDILIVRQMVDKDSKVTILPDPVPDVD